MQWWCSAQGVPWDWSWQAYPGVWVFILLIVAGYRRLLRNVPAAPAEGSRGVRIASFTAGVVFLWLALDWPIGALGAGYLASAHMVQFLLMAFIVPPLILYGVPPAAFEPLRERPILMALIRWTTHPMGALLIFNALIIITHVPAVTDALMSSQLGSLLIDLTWIIAAMIFWWPVIAPLPERRWLHPLIKVGYIAAQLILGKPIFVFLTFADYPVYATYELAPRVHGIEASADQQMAGLLMEVAGALILFVAAAIFFLRWSYKEQGTSIRTDTVIPEMKEIPVE
jgi:putative membrane protein